MPDPVARLKFDGEPSGLTRSLSKVESAMKSTTSGIEKSADRAETALRGVQDAADKIKSLDVKVIADTTKAETDIKGVGDHAGKVEVQTVADTSRAEADIRGLRAPKVEVPTKAEVGPAKQALEGLGDLGSEIGDKFTGGLVGNLKSGIAGAIGGIGIMLVDKLAESVASSNKLSRTLSVQFEKSVPQADLKKYADLFNENILEDLNNFLGGGRGDQNIAFLEDAGIGMDKLAEAAARAHRAFKDFGGMAANDQRALTVELAKVATIGGVDIPDALKGASVAARTWGLNAWDSTRLVGRGFQELDERGSDWADTLNEYSGYFKNIGFSADEMFGVIKQGLDGGAMNTDKVADAFKELGIRVLEQTPEIRGAFQSLGLDADATAQAFARGGPAAKQTLDTIIDRLNATKDPVEQNRLGVALFGTQWEDTMRRAVSSINIAQGSINGLTGAIYAIPGSKSVSVIANVDQARNTIDKFIVDQSGRTIQIHVTAVGTPNEQVGVRNSKGMKAMSKGGPVTGVGTRTSDSNIRALSVDEYVVHADAATKPMNAAVLDAMNSGKDWTSLVPSMAAPPVAFRSGSGGTGPINVTLSVAPGGDQGVATMINYLAHKGLFNFKVK